MNRCSKEYLPKPRDLFLIKQDNQKEFAQRDHNDSAALFNQSVLVEVCVQQWAKLDKVIALDITIYGRFEFLLWALRNYIWVDNCLFRLKKKNTN